MKVFSTIAKIVVVLAAIAGAVYVVATYGDQIVAWAKSLISKFSCCCDCDCGCDCECECDCCSVEGEEIAPANDSDFEG